MTTISAELKFLLQLGRVQSLLHRKFDGGLGGLGFSEFMILYHLSGAPEQKMRRIDLAGKIGLTASGITRILLPMEKVGYISKEVNPKDARVSIVQLAPGGKRRLEESLERAEYLTEEIIPESKREKVKEFSELVRDLGGTIS